MDNESQRVDAILDFWYGQPRDYVHAGEARIKFWFGGAPDVNRAIRERFAADHRYAAENRLDHWAVPENGLLALVILLDQFSRNIYRGSSRAFEWDHKALALSLAAIGDGRDIVMLPLQRLFLYLPLEHAEDPQMQRLSVDKFTALAEQAPEDMHETYLGFLDYAQRHKAIIERFGRFPHRNALLGRDSTAEEKEFLTQPGSSFM
ncbi:MAG TPA: DUF924 family protein [Gammaproteobacteria bacterium]|jgi:uncharacterized protein (DUF924 family)